MKRKIIPAITGLLIIVLSFSLITAEESKTDEETRRQFRRALYWADKGLFDARLILKIKDKIGLTTEQEQRIENLMLAYEEASLSDKGEIKVLELKFASYVKSDKVDRSEIKKLVKEISQRKTDCIVRYLNYLLDLKAVLSAEQYEKIKEFHQKIKEHFKKKEDKSCRPCPESY